jgi:hypothetical protein
MPKTAMKYSPAMSHLMSCCYELCHRQYGTDVFMTVRTTAAIVKVFRTGYYKAPLLILPLDVQHVKRNNELIIINYQYPEIMLQSSISDTIYVSIIKIDVVGGQQTNQKANGAVLSKRDIVAC